MECISVRQGISLTLSKQTRPATAKAIDLAGGLLAGGGVRYKRESNVVSDLVLLLSELGINYLDIEREYDRIDIYLPRYRTIIEAKAKGGAARPTERRSGAPESPEEQLERYVLAEISSERGRLPLSGELPSNVDWTGIITDGQHWHIYAYPHIENPHEKRKYCTQGKFSMARKRWSNCYPTGLLAIRSVGDGFRQIPFTCSRTRWKHWPTCIRKYPKKFARTRKRSAPCGTTCCASPEYRRRAKPPPTDCRYAFVPDRDCPHGDALAEALAGRLEARAEGRLRGVDSRLAAG